MARGEKLTAREAILVRECDSYAVSDVGGEYYRIGGHGSVPLRYHHASLPSLAKRGLVKRLHGYWKATEAGRQALSTLDKTETDKTEGGK